MIQLVVSVILYFVIFFGISFILNMLLRRTWVMSFLYPFVVVIIIDGIAITEYFTAPGESFSTLIDKVVSLTPVDIVVLTSGMVGTIVSGFVIKYLRKSGYQMF